MIQNSQFHERRANPTICLTEEQVVEIARKASKYALEEIDDMLMERLTGIMDKQLGSFFRQKLGTAIFIFTSITVTFIILSAKGLINVTSGL